MEKKRIDTLLVEKQLATTRSKAVQLLKGNVVYVNQKLINKPGCMCNDTDEIVVLPNQVLSFVSRGGHKLQKAITSFLLDLNDKVILDIGASTGGFTDCALKNGAKHVYALDVGTNQLASTLQNHPQVTSLENTNFKDVTLNLFPLSIEIITIDVSFISIRQIILKIIELFKKIEIIALFKPQFEVGKSALSKNGVVRNLSVHKTALKDFQTFLNHHQLTLNELTFSPILGLKEGNIEYLCHITNQKSLSFINIDQVVEEAFDQLRRG